MTKRLSKTLASEIADRTLEVVNPQNRFIALTAALKRHGLVVSSAIPADQLLDKATLVSCLLSTYAPSESSPN